MKLYPAIWTLQGVIVESITKLREVDEPSLRFCLHLILGKFLALLASDRAPQ
jgi:hypothetical protein